MLVDALRESPTPTDEDVIYGVLKALLVSPVIIICAGRKEEVPGTSQGKRIRVGASAVATDGREIGADGSQHGARRPGSGSTVQAG